MTTMAEVLSIGWTQAAARRALRAYRGVLGTSLVVQSLAALVALFWPSGLAGLLGLAEVVPALDWMQVWGVMVLMASAFQISGLIDPTINRLSNLIGITGRGAMAILYVCLGGGFYWLALFDGLFAVLLFIAYRRCVIAELQTRP